MNVYAVVKNASGSIVNRIVLDIETEWEPEEGHSIVADTGEPMQIGGTYIDGVYTAPPSEPLPELPLLLPTSISRRQFFQMAAIRGFISAQEAEDAMSGVIPQVILDALDNLPFDEAQKFDARMLIKGATEFQRRHQLTYLVGYLFDMDSPAIDDFFRDAGAV